MASRSQGDWRAGGFHTSYNKRDSKTSISTSAAENVSRLYDLSSHALYANLHLKRTSFSVQCSDTIFAHSVSATAKGKAAAKIGINQNKASK